MLGTVWMSMTLAMPLYIDGDERCPGQGTDAAPYCSLQAAIDAGVGPGDELLVRDAAAPYTDDDGMVDADGLDGTADAPIVVRPDDGHAPVLSLGISLDNSSHWTLRGLTFIGEGRERAVSVGAWGQSVQGVRIEDNVFLEWGGDFSDTATVTGTVLLAGDNPLDAIVIRGNRFEGGRGRAIYVDGAEEARVEDNVITGLACQRVSFGPDADIIFGIQLRGGRGSRIAGNRISNFDGATCPGAEPDDPIRVIGIVVIGEDDAEIAGNWVEGIGGDADVTGMGIAIAQGSDRADVHHNVVVDAVHCGLCDDVAFSAEGVGTVFRNNTVVGGEIGISARRPDDFTARENIVAGASVSPVRLSTLWDGQMLSWVFERNLYADTDARWVVIDASGEGDHDFEGWQQACGCDAEGAQIDPQLPMQPEDYTPGAASPAVDFGDPVSRAEFLGAAPDAGAFEAPQVTAAEIRDSAPDSVLVSYESLSALQVDPGCAGFTVTVDDEVAGLVSCARVGDGVLEILLAESVLAGQTVALEYQGPWVRDSARIGGLLDAVLQPLSIAVTNGSTNTGASTTGDGSTTGADGSTSTGGAEPGTEGSTSVSGAQGGFPAADGCTCTSGGAGGAGWWMLGLLGLRSGTRRRRPGR